MKQIRFEQVVPSLLLLAALAGWMVVAAVEQQSSDSAQVVEAVTALARTAVVPTQQAATPAVPPTAAAPVAPTATATATPSPTAAPAQPVANAGGTIYLPLVAYAEAEPPVASLPPAEGDVVLGAPTISPELIDAILASYGSPATGSGQVMYDMGVWYGIDPAYCLAFFVMESTAGTNGVATITRSVGNIRTTAGYPDYQGYRAYSSWEESMNDWYRLIRNTYVDQWGLSTIEQIIPVYAPASDNNDPEHYIATVRGLVSYWRAIKR